MIDNFPFNRETIQTIMAGLTAQYHLSPEQNGNEEIYMVPKDGADDAQIKAAVQALEDLLSKTLDPTHTQYTDGTKPLETVIRMGQPPMYRGTDLGAMEVLDDIADAIRTEQTALDMDIIRSVYTFDSETSSFKMLERDRVNQDNIEKAVDLLELHFGAKFDNVQAGVPTKANAFRHPIVAVPADNVQYAAEIMVKEQPQEVQTPPDTAIETVEAVEPVAVAEPIESVKQPQPEELFQMIEPTGVFNEEAEPLSYQAIRIAAVLENAFTVVAGNLRAKPEITPEQISEIKAFAAPLLETTDIIQDGQVIGLAPVHQDQADFMFQMIEGAKAIRALYQQFPDMDRSAAFIEKLFAEHLEKPKQSAPTPQPVIENNQEIDLNDDQQTDKTTEADNDHQTMDNIKRAYQDLTSDDNELAFGDMTADELFNAAKYATLTGTGHRVDGIDKEDIGSEESSLILNTALNNLSDEEKNKLMPILQRAVQSSLVTVPPMKLAEMYREADLGRETDENVWRMNVLRERMDEIIDDYTNGDAVINQDNIADAYEGMMAVLDTYNNGDNNNNVQTARNNLNAEIDKYDADNELNDIIQEDDTYLSARADAVNKVIEGIDLDTYYKNLRFVDDKGAEIPQTDENGVLRQDSELATLWNITKANILTEMTLTKGTISEADIATRANELMQINTVALIAANLKQTGENSQKADNIFENLKAGQPVHIPQGTIAGFAAINVNKQMGLLNRLGTKLGKESATVKKLYAPIKSIDTLASRRFEKDYPKTNLAKACLQKFALGAMGGAIAAGAGLVAATITVIPAASVVAGVMAAYTCFKMWRQREREVAAAEKQGTPRPSLKSFFKKNTTQALLSGAALGAIALGAPVVAMAVGAGAAAMGATAVFKRNRNEGFATKTALVRTVAESLSTLSGAALTGFGIYSVGTEMDIFQTAGAEQTTQGNTVVQPTTETPAVTPEATQTTETPAVTPEATQTAGAPVVTPEATQTAGSPVVTPEATQTAGAPVVTPEATQTTGTNATPTGTDTGTGDADTGTGDTSTVTTPVSEPHPMPQPTDRIDTAGTVTSPTETAETTVTSEGQQTPSANGQPSSGTGRSYNPLIDTTASRPIPINTAGAPVPIENSWGQTPENAEFEYDRPEVTLVPETSLNTQEPITVEETAYTVSEDTPVHHTYEPSDHELAQARLNGEHLYDAAGRPTTPDYTMDQLDNALTQIRELDATHPEFMGSDGVSNADILMYKLNQMDKLVAPDTDLMINGERTTVADAFGVKLENGTTYSPMDLRNDLLSGNPLPITPDQMAQMLSKVETAVDTTGHFTHDVVGFNEARNASFSVGQEAGFKIDPVTDQPAVDEPITPVVQATAAEQPVPPVVQPTVTEQPLTLTDDMLANIQAQLTAAEQPVTPAAQPTVTEQPATPAAQPTVTEQPVTPAAQPTVTEQPVTPAAQPTVTEQPVTPEGQQPAVTTTEAQQVSAPENGQMPQMTAENIAIAAAAATAGLPENDTGINKLRDRVGTLPKAPEAPQNQPVEADIPETPASAPAPSPTPEAGQPAVTPEPQQPAQAIPTPPKPGASIQFGEKSGVTAVNPFTTNGNTFTFNMKEKPIQPQSMSSGQQPKLTPASEQATPQTHAETYAIVPHVIEMGTNTPQPTSDSPVSETSDTETQQTPQALMAESAKLAQAYNEIGQFIDNIRKPNESSVQGEVAEQPEAPVVPPMQQEEPAQAPIPLTPEEQMAGADIVATAQTANPSNIETEIRKDMDKTIPPTNPTENVAPKKSILSGMKAVLAGMTSRNVGIPEKTPEKKPNVHKKSGGFIWNAFLDKKGGKNP